MNALSLPMDLLGGVLLGLYFVVPSPSKITGFDGMFAYMTQHGVPLPVPLLAARGAPQASLDARRGRH